MKVKRYFAAIFCALFISVNISAQLPDNFPQISVVNNGETAEGNVFLTVSADAENVGYYVFMIDNEGNVQNYKELEDDYSYDFKMQPNGLLSYAQFLEHHSYSGGGDCYHLILDQDMNEVDSVQMKNGYIAEAHDFQILPNGHILMFGYYMTQMDLSQIVDGGYPDAKVSGGIIQELDAEGDVVFQWKSWDHYTAEEYDWNRANRQTVSAFHLNTINLDVDGNIIFATPSFTKKLNRQTGEIMWHLGGNENEFYFIGVDSTIGAGYATGHAFYRLENGNYLVYDNASRGSSNPNSEVHEFAIDEQNKTAELVWTYAYPTDIKGWHRGNAYRLPNGNTIIGWGGASGDPIPTCTEIDMDGNILFEAYFDDPDVESYRAFRFPMGDWKVAESIVTELALGNTYEFYQGDTLNTGVEVEVTEVTGGGYNELEIATFNQAPRFPTFEGRDPMLTAQRVTMDPAYFYLSGVIYFDIDVFNLGNPDEITIYYRATEGEGNFEPLVTGYNFVTRKINASFEMTSTQKCEFAFGYSDLQAYALSPVLTTPPNGAEVNYAEMQHLEWSPTGFFEYFTIQIATDENFSNIVYTGENYKNTFYNFDCENNTTYYWRVKSFVTDYDGVFESEWSEISMFSATHAAISVNEPVADAQWQYGLDYFIEWEDNFADDVVIELITDSTQSVIDTVESDGAYKWSIPVETEIGCKYRIRITNVNEPSVFALSPDYFSITDTAGNNGCNQSIGESVIISDVRVFPVPASEVLRTEYVLKEPSYVEICLFDMLGNQVRCMAMEKLTGGVNLHKLPVGDLNNSIYFLRINTETNQIVRKVIVNK